MNNSKPMAGQTLWVGETNNGVSTVLNSRTVTILNSMYERAGNGEPWDDIYDTIPYPWEGIFAFCSPEAWNNGLWQYATGTITDMWEWLDRFRSRGGEVRTYDHGNTVPLSNGFDSGEAGFYPKDALTVCQAFDIPPSMLPALVMS